LEHRKLAYVQAESPIQRTASSFRQITSLPESSDEDLSDHGIPMNLHQEDLPEQHHDFPAFPVDEDMNLQNDRGQYSNKEDILSCLTAQDRDPRIINTSGSSSEGEDDAQSTDSDEEERFLHFPDWESYENEDSFGVEGLKEGFEREAAALGMS
jgi:hypothetical protein